MYRAITNEETVAFFQELYKDNYTTLLHFAHLTLPKVDMMVIEDIVQRTFFEAWKNVDMLRGHCNPKGWLLVTARDMIKAYSRNSQNKKIKILNSNET